MVYSLKSSPKRNLDLAPSGVGGLAGTGCASPDSHLVLDSRAPARFFLVSPIRVLFFASVVAESCLVLDTKFFNSWTISASFALTRLLISRLSPVSGIMSPFQNTTVHAETWRLPANSQAETGIRSRPEFVTLMPLLLIVHFRDGCLVASF
jgi:hypothetical protein